MTYSKTSLLTTELTTELTTALTSADFSATMATSSPQVVQPSPTTSADNTPVRTLNVPPQFPTVSSHVPLKPHYLKAYRVLTLAAASGLYILVSLWWLSTAYGFSIAGGVAAVAIISLILTGDNPHKFRTALVAPLAGIVGMIGVAGLLKITLPVGLLVTSYALPLAIFLSLAIIARRRPNWRLQAVLAGKAEDITRLLTANPSLEGEVIACITDDGATVPGIRIPTMGALKECEHIFVDQDIERVLVTTPECLEPVLDRTAPLNARIEEIYSNPLQSHVVRRAALNIEHRIQKRFFDIAASGSALLLLSPVLILVALAVKLTSTGPVFFRQPRWGRNGRTFKIYKFRSMYVNTCDDGHGTVKQAQKNDSRITKVGGFLRKTSLDELPQLINILIGDMSIIGPRPHAVAHNFQYLPEVHGYAARHRVRPGLSGLAQVEGFRGETPTLDLMQARIDCDNAYIDNWSFWLDVKIIIRTVKLVLARTNAH